MYSFSSNNKPVFTFLHSNDERFWIFVFIDPNINYSLTAPFKCCGTFTVKIIYTLPANKPRSIVSNFAHGIQTIKSPSRHTRWERESCKLTSKHNKHCNSHRPGGKIMNFPRKHFTTSGLINTTRFFFLFFLFPAGIAINFRYFFLPVHALVGRESE